MRVGSVSFDEAAQKNPSVATHRSESKRLQISKSTGSRKHAVHQPAHDPVPLIASRGQVLKVTSSIHPLKCTPPATGFSFVLNVLQGIFEAAGG
jgi:hypothetical protein